MTLPVCHTHMTYIPLDPKLFFTSLNLYSIFVIVHCISIDSRSHTHDVYYITHTHGIPRDHRPFFKCLNSMSSATFVHVLHFYLTHDVSNLICTSHFVYIVWCSLALTSIFEVHSNGCYWATYIKHCAFQVLVHICS